MELRPRHLIGELDSHLDVRLAGAPQSGLQEFGQGVVQVLQRPQLVLQEAPLAIGRLAILDGRTSFGQLSWPFSRAMTCCAS